MSDTALCHKCGDPRGNVNAGILCYSCSEVTYNQVLSRHDPNDSYRRSGNSPMSGPGPATRADFEGGSGSSVTSSSSVSSSAASAPSQSTRNGSALDRMVSELGLWIMCLLQVLVIFAVVAVIWYFALKMVVRMLE